jgi:predicted alpha/beta hydrolase family esterase
MLDFILRNQSLFWGVLSLVGWIPIFAALISNRDFIAVRTVVANLSKRKEVELRRQINSRKWIYLIGLVLAVVCLAFVALRPIPKTAALEFPAPLRQTPSNHHLIVFIHGWRGDPTESWMQFPKLVIKDPRFNSCDVLSLSYPTYISRRSLTIPQLAQWLTEQMKQRDYYVKYDKIFVVAHSLGGLVAREIVIENRLGGIPDMFQELVEIATPHNGANIAGVANTLGIDRAYVKEVEPSSRFLADLRDKWNRLTPRPATFAITSVSDEIVQPASAEEQCDRFQIFPQWSHIELAKPSSNQDDRYVFAMDRILAALK